LIHEASATDHLKRIAFAMKFNSWISYLGRLAYRFRIALTVVLLVLAVILLYPFETITIPQWNVRVVDDTGAPVREINITEHWQHYPVDSSGHEEVQRPNQNGFVSFKPRSIRASLTRRLFARINAGRRSGGRTTPYGAIVAWGSKTHETTVAVYKENETPPAELRVQRLR
jgi:hypothetical protein